VVFEEPAFAAEPVPFEQPVGVEEQPAPSGGGAAVAVSAEANSERDGGGRMRGGDRDR
jgi:hypothetical protein